MTGQLMDKYQGFIVPLQIMKDVRLTPTEKLVLIALRSFANPHTPTVFPSYQTLADLTGFSKRTCMRAVESAANKGYLSKMYQFREDRQTSNIYTLILPECQDVTPESYPQKEVKNELTSDTVSPSPVTESHPPSDTVSPELNHLNQSIKNNTCMYDANDIRDLFRKHFPVGYKINDQLTIEDCMEDMIVACIRRNRMNIVEIRQALRAWDDRANKHRIRNKKNLFIKDAAAFLMDCYDEIEIRKGIDAK